MNTRPRSRPLERPAIPYGRDDSRGSPLIWWGLVALVVGGWALLRRGGGDGPERGTISGQWLAEHRAHERDSNPRFR